MEVKYSLKNKPSTKRSLNAKLAVTTEQSIIYELREINKQIDITHDQLDYCTDDLLIDSCIYRLMSLHSRYDYYITKAKELNISLLNISKKKTLTG